MYVQESLEHRLNQLDDRSKERRLQLEASKQLHEYLRESGEVEEWISAQDQIATSGDYGEDYEHVQVNYDALHRYEKWLGFLNWKKSWF